MRKAAGRERQGRFHAKAKSRQIAQHGPLREEETRRDDEDPYAIGGQPHGCCCKQDRTEIPRAPHRGTRFTPEFHGLRGPQSKREH